MNLQHGFEVAFNVLIVDSEHPLCESCNVGGRTRFVYANSAGLFFGFLSAVAIPAIAKLKLCFVLVFYQPYPYWHCINSLFSYSAPLVGPISKVVSRFF